MDILDNIIFATFNRQLTGPRNIQSDYIPNPVIAAAPTLSNPPAPIVPVYNYDTFDKMNFCAFNDIGLIETGITRHWYDVDNQDVYPSITASPAQQYSSFVDSSSYHLIFAYLIENTRIIQIFETLIERYLNDEILGIPNGVVTFNWINNSERLFFKADRPKATNLRSHIRPSSDFSRRNAYQRLFGMDLAFGNLDQGNTASYVKATSSNQQFVALFERYLSEIWQGYINARNTSGANTSDSNILIELAQQLREMLAARRGDTGNNSYANLNLSREEFSSVLIATWFTFIISYDSPVVNFLSCQSSTIGERLIKIGAKVGVPAHTKCQALFEMASATAQVLLALEAGGIFDNPGWVGTMLSSLNPPVAIPLSVPATYMNAFLTVINNWEKATGHKIKNPEARITGNVRVQSNGISSQPALN